MNFNDHDCGKDVNTNIMILITSAYYDWNLTVKVKLTRNNLQHQGSLSYHMCREFNKDARAYTPRKSARAHKQKRII